MGDTENWSTTQTGSCEFIQHVSASKEVRDASSAAHQKIQEFGIEQGMREDVYRAVLDATKNTSAEKLTTEDRRLMDKIELGFRRKGLALPQDKREKLKEIQKKLTELSTQFSKATNEDETKLTFTKEDLEGLSDDFLSGLTKTTEDGVEKYIVTMKYPDLFPVLKLAKKESTRKAMDLANGAKCKENVARLEEAIKSRREAAQLLDYENHAQFKLEVKMAKTQEAVLTFLNSIRDKVKGSAEKELQTLLDIKKKEKDALGEPFDGKINSWDYQYYNRILLETEYDVDHEKIKNYFSFDVVTKGTLHLTLRDMICLGMLALYEQVLGLKFVELKDFYKWHPDVTLYEVRDSETNEMVGQFYLDLFPRDGKYTHAGIEALFQNTELIFL